MISTVRPLAPDEADAEAVLEAGDVLWRRESFFTVEVGERHLLTPSILTGGSKNVSFDPMTGRLGGTSAAGEAAKLLRGMLARFSRQTQAFVRRTCPAYADGLRLG